MWVNDPHDKGLDDIRPVLCTTNLIRADQYAQALNQALGLLRDSIIEENRRYSIEHAVIEKKSNMATTVRDVTALTAEINQAWEKHNSIVADFHSDFWKKFHITLGQEGPAFRQ